jgi:hypothetical protein
MSIEDKLRGITLRQKIRDRLRRTWQDFKATTLWFFFPLAVPGNILTQIYARCFYFTFFFVFVTGLPYFFFLMNNMSVRQGVANIFEWIPLVFHMDTKGDYDSDGNVEPTVYGANYVWVSFIAGSVFYYKNKKRIPEENNSIVLTTSGRSNPGGGANAPYIFLLLILSMFAVMFINNALTQTMDMTFKRLFMLFILAWIFAFVSELIIRIHLSGFSVIGYFFGSECRSNRNHADKSDPTRTKRKQ